MDNVFKITIWQNSAMDFKITIVWCKCSVAVALAIVSATDLRREKLADEIIEKIIKGFEGKVEEQLVRWTSRGYLVYRGILYRFNSHADIICGSEKDEAKIWQRQTFPRRRELPRKPQAAHFKIILS